MHGIDLEAYRLDQAGQAEIESARLATKRKARTPRSGGWFIWGRIPGEPVSRAASLPGKALHVWLALWTEHHCAKGKPLRLTTELLTRFHVHRNAAYRALGVLERAGLIVCDRKPGRLPVVRLLLGT